MRLTSLNLYDSYERWQAWDFSSCSDLCRGFSLCRICSRRPKNCSCELETRGFELDWIRLAFGRSGSHLIHKNKNVNNNVFFIGISGLLGQLRPYPALGWICDIYHPPNHKSMEIALPNGSSGTTMPQKCVTAMWLDSEYFPHNLLSRCVL